MDKLNVAIVGATGAVGTAMRRIIDERGFPAGDIRLLASPRSAGRRFTVGGQSRTVEVLDDFDFADTQIALFSTGGGISLEHAPRAAAAGAIVIDNTSAFRQRPDIPLIVPEVNGHRIRDGIGPNIIANPNCVAIPLTVACKPIYDAVGIERINVATYQSVSGAGASGVRELEDQTHRSVRGELIDELPVHPAQMAFNVISHAWTMGEDGFSDEETKVVNETRKILEDDRLRVNPTCVRVPVYYGHSMAVHLETRESISPGAACDLLRHAPGVVLMEGAAPTPVVDAAGRDGVFVGRVRGDPSHERGLDLWVVSDNVRKGAALNSIQIAEEVRELIG
ncbi:MAG: aspartate-semialdehyde dehydrogenase [Gammaproteobacteria bacterium]|nr:aspartate-semialdehyde dehydrogenase [Gammaproteobacteria bacterium]MYF27592.1 aspartate-semialdehyde dehydrogenase [Gammaproteobacteria bacterium]MYK48135.1 aspartate-semialdehyde dehydrogenase [Gammaproteobacteria bacterium]